MINIIYRIIIHDLMKENICRELYKTDMMKLFLYLRK